MYIKDLRHIMFALQPMQIYISANSFKYTICYFPVHETKPWIQAPVAYSSVSFEVLWSFFSDGF